MDVRTKACKRATRSSCFACVVRTVPNRDDAGVLMPLQKTLTKQQQSPRSQCCNEQFRIRRITTIKRETFQIKMHQIMVLLKGQR